MLQVFLIIIVAMMFGGFINERRTSLTSVPMAKFPHLRWSPVG
jgi:hypothetical protein